MKNPQPKPASSTPAFHLPDSLSRIDKLEEQLAFQQRELEQLNEVVTLQQSELSEMRLHWTRCRMELDRLRESGFGDELPHEKPPHY